MIIFSGFTVNFRASLYSGASIELEREMMKDKASNSTGKPEKGDPSDIKVLKGLTKYSLS